VDDATKQRTAQGNSDAKEPDRRRVGTIVHDERGNASVKWHDAPAAERRPVLEILGEPKLAVKNEETYDPYAHHPVRGQSSQGGPNRGTGRTRTDLRRLSEWIKMMRELEERKKNGGGNDDR
jgi:hypothetical protein